MGEICLFLQPFRAITLTILKGYFYKDYRFPLIIPFKQPSNRVIAFGKYLKRFNMFKKKFNS